MNQNVNRYLLKRNDGKPDKVIQCATVAGNEPGLLVFRNRDGIPVYMLEDDLVESVEKLPADTVPTAGTGALTVTTGLPGAATTTASAIRTQVVNLNVPDWAAEAAAGLARRETAAARNLQARGLALIMMVPGNGGGYGVTTAPYDSAKTPRVFPTIDELERFITETDAA